MYVCMYFLDGERERVCENVRSSAAALALWWGRAFVLCDLLFERSVRGGFPPVSEQTRTHAKKKKKSNTNGEARVIEEELV